jgi:hypothetical protein
MRTIAPAIMHRIRATLCAALNAAICKRFIDHNPAADVDGGLDIGLDVGRHEHRRAAGWTGTEGVRRQGPNVRQHAQRLAARHRTVHGQAVYLDRADH